MSLIVRPENVSLKNNGGFPLEVEVHTIEYLGREVKLTGKLKDDTILLADILEEIDIITEKHVGDKITLYIKPEDLFVFRDKKRVIRNFKEKKIIFILFSFFCVF
ncbi:MAG: TOBE domain-containing protein [Candidatus Heimdallarchaeaceae archaeon]